jgi:hypothetical protein
MKITYDVNILQKPSNVNNLLDHETRMIRSEKVKEFFLKYRDTGSKFAENLLQSVTLINSHYRIALPPCS